MSQRSAYARLRLTLLARLIGALLALAVVLAVASLVLPRQPGGPALRDPGLPWVRLLDVRDEASVHTWFNVLLLAAAALLAGLNGVLRGTNGAPAWC